MEEKQRKKVALIRGDSLNGWEGKIWDGLSREFDVHGFCSNRNLYAVDTLSYPITRLKSSSDSFFARQYNKFVHGSFLAMSGLEEELSGFDIAHTAEIYYAYTTQAVNVKKKNPTLKVVTTVWDNSFGRFEYNYWPFLSTPPAFWRRKISDIIKKNAEGVDMFLPVSEGSYELLRFYGVSEEKMTVLTPPIVDFTVADPSPVLSRYSLSDKKIYLMVSRLVKEKGVYDVLFAWKLFLGEVGGSSRVLVIVSDGPERNNMVCLCRKLGIDSSVCFISSLANTEVRGLYGRAEALILASLVTPTWQEQFGYVLAEAITANCPVIATNTGAIPEVVGDAAILCPPGNPLALKTALLALEKESVSRSLVKNCEERKKKFMLKTYHEELLSIYRNILL